MKLSENIELLHGDCIDLLPKIPDGSIDAIISDPPYGYLKNQKLDVPFNEAVFFSEAKRVLKPAGFIVLFGRGTAFYRWNTMLADLGFVFKEEIIWNKVQTTSPVLPLSRVHETVSIHCKGKGKINKVRVPYLEMKGHDIGAIKQDIKRLMSVFSNNKSLAAVREYLENATRNYIEPISTKNNNMIFSKKVKGDDRAVRVTACMKDGLKEKSIIQTPSYDKEAKAKYCTSHTGIINGCDRDVAVIDIMTRGLREKSIMQQGREHYTMQHPTQKPARLLERLMALVTQENALVLDPFMGSASTGVACINTSRKFIGMELDDEYFDIAKQRIATALQEKGE
ncbi:MAG: DNA-methyltransferase [Treponema sp.]|uniref:DNA-methyltransferase n=1 Tax=Treponema sp. TaxID=166 RepID=UPI003FA2186F